MKLTVKNIRVQFNETNDMELVLTTNKADVSSLKKIIADNKLLIAEIKQFRAKRSLDSNSYAWVLIGKMADVLQTEKEAVYIQMLTRYGQREPQLLSVLAEAVEMVYRATKNHCVEVGESELKGKVFKHLAILIGSSEYDSKQMTILIDGIISEAKEMGIETDTPEELSRLKEVWNGL